MEKGNLIIAARPTNLNALDAIANHLAMMTVIARIQMCATAQKFAMYPPVNVVQELQLIAMTITRAPSTAVRPLRDNANTL